MRSQGVFLYAGSISNREGVVDMTQAAVLTAEEGYYHVQLGFFKVVVSPKSGNAYAKRYVPETGKWEYYPGAVTRLRPEFKMGLEQAKEFGKLYGRCIRCSKVLTDETSIEQSMGPVCISKF